MLLRLLFHKAGNARSILNLRGAFCGFHMNVTFD
jgi:hypothetical protein